jgi:hypothetical protein
MPLRGVLVENHYAFVRETTHSVRCTVLACCNMKAKNMRVLCLFAAVSALAGGCAVEVSPPRVDVAAPDAVVSVGVPDYYVWDGVEYVGMVGGTYMYLGPGGTWLVCDSVRLGRFHGWERGHPDWRRTAIHNMGRNARGRGPVRREEHHEERR